MRSGAWQANVRRVDPDLVHEMENADLLFERRIGDRRGLQTVAEGLVVEFDATLRVAMRLLIVDIPVVNQIVFVHLAVILAPEQTHRSASTNPCPTQYREN